MKKHFKQINREITTGFTLVETLVAISIFTLSVLVMLVVLGGGISDANHSKNKLVASYLAQEGIELMRSLRDTYVLYGGDTGWTDFQTAIVNCGAGASAGGSGCYLYDQNSLVPPITEIEIYDCTPSGGFPCQELNYSEGDGYSYDQDVGNVGSGFARVILVEDVNQKEKKITSTVHWFRGTNDYKVSFSSYLFDWMPSI
ncbi:hypothetical protein A2914_01160 [Candidatus Nomurabacteria bacterium RIFCSPLOWO2_01_FULL_41_21]|uniref:Type II secretion system protein J n=2 Tax=Candidatus Nomuraibacteriota TaxID=1752729 RepID=A0A1F6V2U3_9BACT|nr:MAG: hypothetical protein A2733_02250 [Candidatus Nomurabacteria bacterium RIFCSPHIGHO2_01_FULL_40_20]OGI87920.1 MAG: hypothetical protein A2914_01160 [Candidatus Nomurabacteria bacterium RIFCSPLOWO2_01_FULL_41_21]